MAGTHHTLKIFFLMTALLAVSILSDASIITRDIAFAEESDITLNNNSSPKISKNIFSLNNEVMNNIEFSVRELSLYQKCAQMVMPAVYRGALNPASKDYQKIIELVKDYGVGGVVLFQGNSTDQKNMIWRLQSLSKIPLLVSGDYENGLGMRIDDAVNFPHSMAVGATYNTDFAYQVGNATAIEGRKMGINFNLAPVADVNDNPLNPIINIRAYSQDKKDVSSFVNAFVKGSNDGKMLTSIKHFPGHGNTIVDSHHDLPRITGSKEYLLENELYPFIQAINKGIKTVMIGHLEVPSLDNNAGTPASLSYPIVTQLLKEELGFEGLVITDAIDMRAITRYYSQEEAAVKAVLAGNDIILSPLKPKEVIDAIYNAVNEGIINEARVNESVKKILSAKYWLGLLDGNSVSGNPEFDKQKILAQRIADESITLLKNDGNILPLNLSEYTSITNVIVTDGVGGLITEYFGDILKKKRNDLTSSKITLRSKKRDYDNVKSAALKSDLIIISSFVRVNAQQGPVNIPSQQQELISGFIKSGKKVILISFNNPYLISKFPDVKTYINTYSNTIFSQEAVLKAVLGEIEFKGKLPISIPETNFKIGDGINFDLTLNN
ncbi:MAG TPA: glycoside hydrolase family 3 N-terminal domain-containing protein [Ignavibacteriaceae bacterium]|nr:glycoside hydrolase family 3 N-terminal domain-containing protein [Ignavibacteriaceae bacterium]